MTILDLTSVNPRIKMHKDALIHIIKPDICLERAIHYTAAYKSNLAQPMVIRRALALKHHLAEKTIWSKHDELIVGNQACSPRAAPIFPEYAVGWIEEEMDVIGERPGAGFAISDDNKQTLKTLCQWWHGQTVVDRCYALFSDEHKSLLETVMIKAEGNMNAGDAHLAVNFPLVLENGIDGIIAQVKARQSQIKLTQLDDFYANQFLTSVAIALQAMSAYIERYSLLAEMQAQHEPRDWRKAELLTIANNCRHIAHKPPETFWQALQLCYFIMLVLQIESNGHSVSFGRLDQYLYPWYQQDVEIQQTLSKQLAVELLQSCWLKLLEVNKIRSGSHSKASAGSPMYQNVTIGGQKWVNGKASDAVNPLSYTILESCGRLQSTQPNLSVRYHHNLSDDFLDACAQVIRCGFGMPAFNNDEIVIPEFIRLGVAKEDAYDYSAIGCIETAVPGKWGYRCTGMSFINFARIVLATLNGGKDTTSGITYLPHDKSLAQGNFTDFAQIEAEWARQIAYYTQKSIEIEYIIDTILEENAHDVICSALVDNCIERGKTLKQGGAKYDWVSGLQVGIANIGNSLAAVKKLIFDDQLIHQQALAAALDNNFANLDGEQLRLRLLNLAPKYGNDNDDVDMMLVQAYQRYIDELKKYHNPRYGRGPIGGDYYAGTSSISANVPFGAQTAATPDGRKAWTPLAEGASPSSGTDMLGPTAVLNSVAKLPTKDILGGVLLNQKLNPNTLDNERDRHKLILMLRVFFDQHKGWHVQYNVVSRETLLKAKADPDSYRDLVVRVAGYSAFFTALSADTQNDIIARTEHVIG